MSDAQIRPATQADSRTIRRMIRAAGLDPISLNWRHFLVAEHDGQIVGVGQIREYFGCRELGSLLVLPSHRGKGIAAEIIAALEARAERPLYLLCQEQMADYYGPFGYQRMGFREAPTPLKLKILAPMIFRLFGVKIIMMRKD